QLVETNSNGELSISLHFGESSEHDIVYDLAEGKVDMGLVAINNYTPFAPSAGVFALPYLFPTVDSAKQLINSEKMKDISSKAALESGVRPISFFIGGYRTLLNNKLAVKTTSDLANLKIRVPRNQLMIEAFRSWGVEPYPIAWPEVYPALSSNIIQGMDNPLNIANAGIGKEKPLWQYYKFATKIKYFLFTAPHLISEQSLLSMTKKHRDIVLEAANEAQKYSWRQTQTKELELIKQAKNGGMIFIEPYDEPSDWQAKAKATWPKMYFRVGGKKHVEETVKTINGQ
ncbi:TRAP transporter substrate-binding protein, partial [Pseudoalteromonas sp. G4]|uniref:TRAP transporter substrate-binding protein n=1 Tax=Pseudoalteromonas sp. G4 TaxID=2992761 RepID=UPI00237DBCB4